MKSEPEISMSPLLIFRDWFKEHLANTKSEHPAACVLSTLGLDGFPNARNVALKEITDQSIVVTGSIQSRKGQEINLNPKVALTFWWEELARQIRVQGQAIPLDEESADLYFAERNKAAQVISSFSKQGEPLANHDIFKVRYDHLMKQYANTQVPRPEHWGGFRIVPIRMEFLTFQSSRFHDRLLYIKNEEGWNIETLQP